MTALAVVDLEGTCCNDGSIPDQERETIEIGAVMLDLGKREIVGDFSTLVRPVKYPILTEFCQDLTGITTTMVSGEPTFPEAAGFFDAWLDQFGCDAWCSWGKYDRDQLQRDGHRRNWTHINLAGNFKRIYHRGKGRILKLFGCGQVGNRHRGLDDAMTYAKMVIYHLVEKNDVPALFPELRT